MNTPCILLLSIWLASAPSGNRVYKLDAGSESSPLRDGFAALTAKSAYSAQTGFGWKSPTGLKTHYQAYQREWKHNESRGRAEPPPIYANELTCDAIYSDQPNTLLVDLPDGRYTVWLLCGRSEGSKSSFFWFDVSAGSAQATLKIPGPFIFHKQVFQIDVRAGQLALQFTPKTLWVLAGLVICPFEQEAALRAEFLNGLEQEIWFLPPDVAAKWRKVERIDDRTPAEFSPADRQRGYALFARHWSEVIYPHTLPRAAELNPDLTVFASLGEYEPLTFTIHPLGNVGRTQVRVGPLRCGAAVLPAENVDVRYVRYMNVRPNYSTYYLYHTAPDVLEHKEAVSLVQGTNQTVWITVKVPQDAQPGVYEGRITVQPEAGQPAEVPLKVRVLPIRLRANPEHIYGAYYHDPLSGIRSDNHPLLNEYLQRKAELERQDMVAHGMNSHVSAVTGLTRDADGNWTCDGTETESRIALDRKYGLADKPLVVSFPVGHWYSRLVDKQGLGSHMRLVRDDVPQSFFDEVTKMVEAIQREKQKYQWPELLYYPIDEPNTHESSVRFMVNVLKAIKRVPGVRTYVTADPSHEQFAPMWPYVDVWCCQPFVWDYDTVRRLSKEKNIEFWCYPNHISGENDHTPVRGARMTFGFGFWKSGFRTLIPWIYSASVGDPWNYLDGTSQDFMVRSTDDGDPVPVALWEAFREGIDDGRYLYTLEQLVAEGQRAGGSAAQAADQAQKEIKGLWDAIRTQEKYKYDNLWSGADFDARRWLLALKILELQKVLGAK